MKFILLSGLPGTGKSAIAEAIGFKLKIPVFAKDWLEANLVTSALISSNRDPMLGVAGYNLLTLLARRQMKMGQSVILDCVASTESIRNTWKEIARQFDAKWRVIECICSDEELHKERLRERKRNIPGWYELEWADVERIKSYFAPWNEPRLILDSIYSCEANIAKALDYSLK
ncbi:MAG: ATP-binding protein [Chloroflexi bacterium]|nr:ATP-binding protein [Chloroflexota bacterium]